MMHFHFDSFQKLTKQMSMNAVPEVPNRCTYLHDDDDDDSEESPSDRSFQEDGGAHAD
jgi:hypothetical protein